MVSYRLFVHFGVSLAGQTSGQVLGQTGEFVFEEPPQTEQCRSQEQVFFFGFTARWPEPAHGQKGAEDLGWRLVPHEELH